MMDELDLVVLLTDVPAHKLKAGDIGTIVYVHEGGKGYEVEFMTLSGETISVESLPAQSVRLASGNEIAHARRVTEAAYP